MKNDIFQYNKTVIKIQLIKTILKRQILKIGTWKQLKINILSRLVEQKIA